MLSVLTLWAQVVLTVTVNCQVWRTNIVTTTIGKSTSKTYKLDPMTSKLVKQYVPYDVMTVHIMNIINKRLVNRTSDNMKVAIITPTSKKYKP